MRMEDNGFGAMHEADYYLAIAEAVGATTQDKRFTVPLNEEERQQARTILYENQSSESSNHPIIAMHPGSGGYSTLSLGAGTFRRTVGHPLCRRGRPACTDRRPRRGRLAPAHYEYDAIRHACTQPCWVWQHQSCGTGVGTG